MKITENIIKPDLTFITILHIGNSNIFYVDLARLKKGVFGGNQAAEVIFCNQEPDINSWCQELCVTVQKILTTDTAAKKHSNTILIFPY